MTKHLKHNPDKLAEKTIDDIFRILTAKKNLKEGERYWFGISGSWRKTNKEVEESVRDTVREILSRGGGIVSGGALNVDSFATDEALKIDPSAIKIFLPVTLSRFAAHYRKRADEGVITHKQAEDLIELLSKLKEANPTAIIENQKNLVCNQETYYERNTAVMNASDALIAFQVNDSEGVGDTLAKAIEQDKPIRRLKYTID